MRDDQSEQLLEHLKTTTPARIAVGRRGTRPPTAARIAFLADHAEARDAVNSELSDHFVELFCRQFAGSHLQSLASSRSDYVLFPPKGKKVASEDLPSPKKDQACDIQIVIADGLSARAVEENVMDLYPMLVDGFADCGLKISAPVVVRYGRVAIADQIAHAVGAKLAINLIGERPGLSCATGLSAYITYNPNPATTISSDRTVVSNIHNGGTPPVEAGAFIVKVSERIFRLGVSGVKLQAQSQF